MSIDDFNLKGVSWFYVQKNRKDFAVNEPKVKSTTDAKSMPRSPKDPKAQTGQKKAAKSAPTQTRITAEQKTQLAESDRAIFAAVPKTVRKNRHSAHMNLRAYIAALNSKGLEAIVASGDSYYAVVLDTTEHRDKALAKMLKSSYKGKDGEPIKTIYHKFGDPAGDIRTIWTIAVGPLGGNLKKVRDAVIAHVSKLSPGYSTTFVLRKKLECETFSGTVAIRFEDPPPDFKKQMVINGMVSLVTQEPPNTCRFCGCSGHDIFGCEAKCDKELGKDVVEGKIGAPEAEMEL